MQQQQQQLADRLEHVQELERLRQQIECWLDILQQLLVDVETAEEEEADGTTDPVRQLVLEDGLLLLGQVCLP